MGGGLRAYHLGLGLQSHDLEVHFLCRNTWAEKWAQMIASTIQSLNPDVVLCVQLEDAYLLPPVDCPVIIDLYAPRLLEVAFAPDQHQTASHIIHALSRGDLFLVSNQFQSWHWLGIFALAGIDVRTDPSIVVPLAAEFQQRTSSEQFTLVGGGLHWPWQSRKITIAW